MDYKGYTTFNTEKKDGVLYVTIDYPPVNVQGQAMLADLNSLAMRLERDRETKVVVFQSAHPEIWVCHYDTELLKDMSTEAVSRDEAKLLDLQYESIDKPIDEALKAEAYCRYQATSKTPAIKRFTIADEKGMEHDMENQRNWNDLVMAVQDIN